MSATTPTSIAQPHSLRQPSRQHWPAIRKLLLESSHLYPGIEVWWEKTVVPELHTRRRVLILLDGADKINGVFIAKGGIHAKVCTLRLREEARNQGLGTALMAEGLRSLLQSRTKDVLVTISEAARASCQPFFEAFGFRCVAHKKGRYVRGVDELIYKGSARELRHILRDMLQHHAGAKKQSGRNGAVLFSLRPEFAQMFLQGRKSVEFRRRFSRKHAGTTAVFYVTHPIRQFLFSGVISEVEHGSTTRLWQDYGQSSGLPRNAFRRYFKGVTHGFAILLQRCRPLPRQLTLEGARALDPKLRPPQSFKVLEAASPLLASLGVCAD